MKTIGISMPTGMEYQERALKIKQILGSEEYNFIERYACSEYEQASQAQEMMIASDALVIMPLLNVMEAIEGDVPGTDYPIIQIEGSDISPIAKYFIKTDFVRVGERVAEYVKEKIELDYSYENKSIEIFSLNGAEDFKLGVENVFAEYDEDENVTVNHRIITPADETTMTNEVENILISNYVSAGEAPSAIICVNDLFAKVACEVLDENGFSDVVVTGYDLREDTEGRIDCGQQTMTVIPNYLEYALTVRNIVDWHFYGKTPMPPDSILVNGEVVGKNTVGIFFDSSCAFEPSHSPALGELPRDEDATLVRIDAEQCGNSVLYEGLELPNNSKIVVTATYSNGSQEDVTDYCGYSPYSVTKSIENGKIEVSYNEGDLTACDTVTVGEVATATGITATVNKQSYDYGEDISKGDIIVKCTYRTDSGREIAIDVTNFEFSPKIAAPRGDSERLQINIRCNVGNVGFTASQYINVKNRPVSMETVTAPTKRIYHAGEAVDLSGMTVCVTYSSGYCENKTADHLTADCGTLSFCGNRNSQTVTVSCNVKGTTLTTTYDVYRLQPTDENIWRNAQDMGDVGMGYTNYTDGTMRYIYRDLSHKYNGFPIEVYHVYKRNSGWNYGVGNDWKLNLHKEVKKKENVYRYIDEIGKEYVFENGCALPENRSRFSSSIRQKTSKLNLHEISSDKVILTDSNANSMIFEAQSGSTAEEKTYRLTRICHYPYMPHISDDENNAGKYLSIVYEGNKIVGIKYVDNYSLEEKSYTLEYSDGGRLKAIKAFEDAKPFDYPVEKYEYDNNGNLVEAQELWQAYNGGIEQGHTGTLMRRAAFTYGDSFGVTNLSEENLLGAKRKLCYVFSGDKVSGYDYGYGNELSHTDVTIKTYEDDTNGETEIIEGNVNYNGYNVVAAAILKHRLFGINEGRTTCIFTGKNRMTSECSYVNGGITEPRKTTYISNGFDDNQIIDTYGSESVLYAASGEKGKSLTVNIPDNKGNRRDVYVCGLAYLGRDSSGCKIQITVNGVAYSYSLACDLGEYQYFAVPVGLVRQGNEVKIELIGEGNIYLRDIKIVCGPYVWNANTPRIVSNTYTDCGKIQEEFVRNPIDGYVYKTIYRYNEYLQPVLKYECKYIYNPIDKVNDTTPLRKTVYKYDTTTRLLAKVMVGTEFKDGEIEDWQSLDDTGSQFNYYTITDISYSKDGTKSVTTITDGDGVTVKNGNRLANEGVRCLSESVIGETDAPTVETERNYHVIGDNFKSMQTKPHTLTQGASYDENNRLSSVYSGNRTYNFTYDSEDRLISIDKGGENLVEYGYTENPYFGSVRCGNLIKEVYNESDEIVRIVDKSVNEDGTTKHIRDTEIVTSDTGTIVKENDRIVSSSVKENAVATVNIYGEDYNAVYCEMPPKYEESQFKISNELGYSAVFDSDNNFNAYSAETCVNSENKVVKVAYGAELPGKTYDYDKLGRLTKENVGYANGFVRNFSYDYYDVKDANDSSRASNRVKSQVRGGVNVNGEEGFAEDERLWYEYYVNGNVKSISKGRAASKVTQIEYTYDDFGRLHSERNREFGKKIVYDYDDYGNITEKTVYSYAGVTAERTDAYTYSGDKLVSYNGNAVTYDSVGNPLSYMGKTFTWEGKRLKSVTIGGSTLDFAYNHEGMRTKKGDVSYFYVGEKLLGEAKGNTVISYLYGANGIEGILVDRHGETASRNAYVFEKNIFGDVIAIYDEDGGLCYKYTYDAWGNHRIYDGSALIYDSATGVIATGYENHIAILNPIRYRGYYYDTETGLYYLQSRYYDATLCRFLNRDNVNYLEPESIHGLNLYAYYGDSLANYKQVFVSLGGYLGGGNIASVNNRSVPWLAATAVGVFQDFVLGIRYLAASGMHSKFAYATKTRYMYPIMGGTWRWFGKSSSSFGAVAQGAFKQILTKDARAGFGTIAKSVGGTVGLNALINFAFNFFENGGRISWEMVADTAIDTAIGVGSYYLAAGAMSLATAGLLAVGISLPGAVVVGCVMILSIGFEHLIRAILDCWD